MKREKVPLITDDDQTSQEQLTSPLKEKKKKQKKNVFSKLNADVILSIFKHFTFKEMTTLALVCKQWRDITTRDELWIRAFTELEWPVPSFKEREKYSLKQLYRKKMISIEEEEKRKIAEEQYSQTMRFKLKKKFKKNISKRWYILLIILLAFIDIIAFLTLLCVKIDSFSDPSSSFTYLKAFAPLYIALFCASAGTFIYTRRQASANLIDLLKATSLAAFIVLLDVFVILINFQLDSKTFDESWSIVFAPFLMVVSLIFVWNAYSLVSSVRKCWPSAHPSRFGAQVGWTFISLFTLIVIFIFCGCLITKLEDSLSMNWWGVFSVLFVWLGFLVIADIAVAIGHVIYSKFRLRNTFVRKYLWCGGPDLVSSIVHMMVNLVAALFLILLCIQLESSELIYTAAEICGPLFFIIGIAFIVIEGALAFV